MAWGPLGQAGEGREGAVGRAVGTAGAHLCGAAGTGVEERAEGREENLLIDVDLGEGDRGSR